MKKEKLWIVSELFYPEETATSYIMTKIANKMSEKYEVHVIAGPECYEGGRSQKSLYFSLNERVALQRVSCPTLNKNSLIKRTLRFFILGIKLSMLLYRGVSKKDKVLIVTNPAPLLILASWMKRLKSFSLFILVHDIFPENTIPAGVIRSKKTLIFRVLQKLFDKAYSRADVLISLGRDMSEVLQSKIARFSDTPQIVQIENWGDVDHIKPLRRESAISESFQSKIVFQYAGNLGRVQGLLELLKVISEVKRSDLHFLFYGQGAVENEMKGFVHTHKLSNVTFCGLYSREEQNQVLNNCDCAIVTLCNGMYGLGVPSKSYNILSAGKPILYIGNLHSETALMIKEHKLGYCFEATDIEGIKTLFESIQLKEKSLLNDGMRLHEFVEHNYSEEVILNKFLEVI